MEKMFKKLFIIFFVTISLFANSVYLKQVYSYDKKMSLANDSEMLKIFHSLQNLYIKAIINNDKELKIATLQRLVKSSKILNIDSRNYKRELSSLLKKQQTTHKTKKYKAKIVSKKRVKLRLTLVITKDDGVKLFFNKRVKSDDIKSFTLKSRRYYRKVYDFKTILAVKSKIKTPKIINKLRVAQYNKSITRVVLKTRKRRKYYLKIDNKQVSINFFPAKKSSKKFVSKSNRKWTTSSPSKKIIVLDPGHGGKDSGAIGYQRRYEKRAVLKIALKTAKELTKRGYKVYLTRSGDYFVKLRNRTSFANRKKADLFISIHANAAPKRNQYMTSKGLETFFLSPHRSKRSEHVAAMENKTAMRDMDYYSKNIFLSVMNRAKIIQANKMALDVQQGILKSLRRKFKVVDGGVREAPFWVLVGAQMPAILIETGYITNPTEGVRLFNFQYENLIAKGIADGVDNYFLKN